MQITLSHSLVDGAIQLNQKISIVSGILQLFLGQITGPVALLLLLRNVQLQVTLDHVGQAMFEVGHPIGQDATSQHCAANGTCRVDTMHLEPANIERSIVRQPKPLLVEQIQQHIPAIVI